MISIPSGMVILDKPLNVKAYSPIVLKVEGREIFHRFLAFLNPSRAIDVTPCGNWMYLSVLQLLNSAGNSVPSV